MKNCKDCQTNADCTCKGKDFKARSFYVNNTPPPILDDALCQQILEKVEENGGLSHNAWDMCDPLELIADIIHTADKIRAFTLSDAGSPDVFIRAMVLHTVGHCRSQCADVAYENDTIGYDKHAAGALECVERLTLYMRDIKNDNS